MVIESAGEKREIAVVIPTVNNVPLVRL